jgi:hypothetical protein
VQDPPADQRRVRDEPVAVEAQRVHAAEGVLVVGVGEVVAEGGVAEGADGRQVGDLQLGRMTNQDVLHAMS